MLNLFLHGTVQTEVRYPGDKVSYEMLIKHEKLYIFLKPAILNNNLTHEGVLARNIRKIYTAEETSFYMNVFSMFENQMVIICIAVLFGGILCFGIFYEIIRRYCGTCRTFRIHETVYRCTSSL